jgi:hypothetical protein
MPSRAKYSACIGTISVSAAASTASLHGFEGLAQAQGAILGRGQFDIGAGQVLRAGQKRQKLDLGGQNHLFGRGLAHQHVINGVPVVVALETEAGGAVGLGVAVHQKDFEAFESEAGGQVDGRGGLADSALLIDYAEYLAHGFQE